MEIRYLSDNLIYIDTITQWLYDEFVKNIRHGVSYEQIFNKYKVCYKKSLPVRLIAVIDEVCVGTVSLTENDLKCRDYSPWLAALYVDKAYQGNKIAEYLIERVKDITRDSNYNELFLRTEHASEYYKKRGWEFVEACVDEYNLNTEVFKYTLADRLFD